MRMLDLSFNQLGVKRNGQFGLKMGETCNSGYLTHLDLSYNSLDEAECKVFGDLLKENHTLWGIHMMGNDCTVDSMGFIRLGIRSKTQSRDVLHKGIENGHGFLSNVRK